MLFNIEAGLEREGIEGCNRPCSLPSASANGLAKSFNPRADKEKSRDMLDSGGVEILSLPS